MKKAQIEITLTEAQPKHARGLLDFYRKVGGETDYLDFDGNGLGLNQEQEQRYLKSIDGSLNNRVLIALLEDEMIGVCTVSAPENRRSEHIGELGIAIVQRYWGFGLSRIMMADMIEWAEDSPVLRALKLEVSASNIRAVKLYQKYGFVQWGKIPQGMYRLGEYEDTILMGRSVLNDDQSESDRHENHVNQDEDVEGD